MFGKQIRDLPKVEYRNFDLETLGDIDSVEIAKEGVKEIYQSLAGVEGYLDYLKDTMNADIKRYFNAQTDGERQLIRGAFARTSFIRALILDTLKK